MRRLTLFLSSAAMATLVAHSALAAPTTISDPDNLQYVVISFDGAHENALWQRSRDLAREVGGEFTYFLSCVFLLSPETKANYQAPGYKSGRSNVGFAQSKEEIATRLSHIWAAHQEGHDIASHACGHFDGKDWTKADWLNEFSQFTSIVKNAYQANGIDGEPEGWKHFATKEIVGFRVPYLSRSKGLSPALVEAGFHYDASDVSEGPISSRMIEGMPHYALPRIEEGPRQRRVIAMDYNLYVRHSKGEEMPDRAAEFSERSYAAFKQAYEREVKGDRRPFQIGFHFNLMNGGAYWDALERFTREVCVRPDTKCISYEGLEKLRRAPETIIQGG